MQESLLNTATDVQDQRVNIAELEIILDSNIEEVVSLCKKACLKPKTDKSGKAYFTGEDVNVLKKMKMLYKQSQNIQQDSVKEDMQSTLEPAKGKSVSLDSPDNKVNFLTKAKNRIKEASSLPSALSGYPAYQIKTAMDKLENNLISKMSDILSEKMDGFDEIIVELIRSKTENETLRQQVNSLNKQLYILKKELSAFSPVALNIYYKKEID